MAHDMRGLSAARGIGPGLFRMQKRSALARWHSSWLRPLGAQFSSWSLPTSTEFGVHAAYDPSIGLRETRKLRAHFDGQKRDAYWWCVRRPTSPLVEMASP